MLRPRIATVLFASFVAGALRGDVIVLKTGDRYENVKIVSEDLSTISFEEDGYVQQVDAELIDSLTHESGSTRYRQGRVALQSGDYETAVEKFGQCKNSRLEWVAPHAKFGMASALKGLGKYSEAAAKFSELVSAYAEHYLAPEALFQKGECEVLGGDAATALSTFEELKNVYGTGKDLKRAELASEFGRGLAFKAQGEIGDARRAFDAVVRKARGEDYYKKIVSHAQLESGRTFLAEERWENARQAFEDLLDENNFGTLAGVYTGLGEALLKIGGEENLRSAQLWFLRVVLMLSGDRVSYKKALEGAIFVTEQLNEPQRLKQLQEEYARSFGD